MNEHRCLYCGELHPPEDTCVSLHKAITREELLAINPGTRPVVMLSDSLEETVLDDAPLPLDTILGALSPGDPGESWGSTNEEKQPALGEAPLPERLPTLLGMGEAVRRPAPAVVEPPAKEPTPAPAPEAPMAPAPRREAGVSEVGGSIGEYELLSLLGEGGMGRVLRARHMQDGSEVAIKILRPEVALYDEVVRRFFQEAKLIDAIKHPNVIDIVELGRTKFGEYFISMELLQGETLGAAMARGAPFSVARMARIARQLCSALGACHQKGVAHRDLKAENVFLIEQGGAKDVVKVLDFGLAKLYNSNAGITAAPMVSAPGMVLGTPVCMSPEQATGEPIDQQTDIYALGVLLYQMATGQLPFFDPNPIVLLKLHLTVEPERPSKHVPSMSRALEALILRCLEKEKRRRFRSVEEVMRALDAACPPESATLTARPRVDRWLVIGASAIFVSILVIAWLISQWSS